MKSQFILRLSALAFGSLLLSGCTTEAWYEGVKRGAENQCRQAVPPDADQCLSRLNTRTYDDYSKARSGQQQ
jgi:PBP1b-binding outer membrane lipoprotein LpoB